jgi:hypothetical protein
VHEFLLEESELECSSSVIGGKIHSFLTMAPGGDGWSVLCSAPLFLPLKNPRYPLDGRMSERQSWHRWWREKSHDLPALRLLRQFQDCLNTRVSATLKINKISCTKLNIETERNARFSGLQLSIFYQAQASHNYGPADYEGIPVQSSPDPEPVRDPYVISILCNCIQT